MKIHWNWNPERGTKQPYPRCLRKAPNNHYTAMNLALDQNGKAYRMTEDKEKVTCKRCQWHITILMLLSDAAISEAQVRQVLKWETSIKNFTQGGWRMW